MGSRMADLKFENRALIIRGRICRVARMDADDYKFLPDPESVISALRASNVKADVFTFLPKLPETEVKYPYPYEMDNMAVLPITTFDNWWTKQIGFKARNKAKQAEKKGPTIREVPFDENLSKGIWEIYTKSQFDKEGDSRTSERPWNKCTR